MRDGLPASTLHAIRPFPHVRTLGIRQRSALSTPFDSFLALLRSRASALIHPFAGTRVGPARPSADEVFPPLAFPLAPRFEDDWDEDEAGLGEGGESWEWRGAWGRGAIDSRLASRVVGAPPAATLVARGTAPRPVGRVGDKPLRYREGTRPFAQTAARLIRTDPWSGAREAEDSALDAPGMAAGTALAATEAESSSLSFRVAARNLGTGIPESRDSSLAAPGVTRRSALGMTLRSALGVAAESPLAGAAREPLHPALGNAPGTTTANPLGMATAGAHAGAAAEPPLGAVSMPLAYAPLANVSLEGRQFPGERAGQGESTGVGIAAERAAWPARPLTGSRSVAETVDSPDTFGHGRGATGSLETRENRIVPGRAGVTSTAGDRGYQNAAANAAVPGSGTPIGLAAFARLARATLAAAPLTFPLALAPLETSALDEASGSDAGRESPLARAGGFAGTPPSAATAAAPDRPAALPSRGSAVPGPARPSSVSPARSPLPRVLSWQAVASARPGGVSAALGGPFGRGATRERERGPAIGLSGTSALPRSSRAPDREWGQDSPDDGSSGLLPQPSFRVPPPQRNRGLASGIRLQAPIPTVTDSLPAARNLTEVSPLWRVGDAPRTPGVGAPGMAVSQGAPDVEAAPRGGSWIGWSAELVRGILARLGQRGTGARSLEPPSGWAAAPLPLAIPAPESDAEDRATAMPASRGPWAVGSSASVQTARGGEMLAAPSSPASSEWPRTVAHHREGSSHRDTDGGSSVPPDRLDTGDLIQVGAPASSVSPGVIVPRRLVAFLRSLPIVGRPAVPPMVASTAPPTRLVTGGHIFGTESSAPFGAGQEPFGPALSLLLPSLTAEEPSRAQSEPPVGAPGLGAEYSATWRAPARGRRAVSANTPPIGASVIGMAAALGHTVRDAVLPGLGAQPPHGEKQSDWAARISGAARASAALEAAGVARAQSWPVPNLPLAFDAISPGDAEPAAAGAPVTGGIVPRQIGQAGDHLPPYRQDSGTLDRTSAGQPARQAAPLGPVASLARESAAVLGARASGAIPVRARLQGPGRVGQTPPPGSGLLLGAAPGPVGESLLPAGNLPLADGVSPAIEAASRARGQAGFPFLPGWRPALPWRRGLEARGSADEATQIREPGPSLIEIEPFSQPGAAFSPLSLPLEAPFSLDPMGVAVPPPATVHPPLPEASGRHAEPVRIVVDWPTGQRPWDAEDLPPLPPEVTRRFAEQGVRVEFVRGRAVASAPAASRQLSDGLMSVSGPLGPIVLEGIPWLSGAVPVVHGPGHARLVLAPTSPPAASLSAVEPLVLAREAGASPRGPGIRDTAAFDEPRTALAGDYSGSLPFPTFGAAATRPLTPLPAAIASPSGASVASAIGSAPSEILAMSTSGARHGSPDAAFSGGIAMPLPLEPLASSSLPPVAGDSLLSMLTGPADLLSRASVTGAWPDPRRSSARAEATSFAGALRLPDARSLAPPDLRFPMASREMRDLALPPDPFEAAALAGPGREATSSDVAMPLQASMGGASAAEASGTPFAGAGAGRFESRLSTTAYDAIGSPGGYPSATPSVRGQGEGVSSAWHVSEARPHPAPLPDGGGTGGWLSRFDVGAFTPRSTSRDWSLPAAAPGAAGSYSKIDEISEAADSPARGASKIDHPLALPSLGPSPLALPSAGRSAPAAGSDPLTWAKLTAPLGPARPDIAFQSAEPLRVMVFDVTRPPSPASVGRAPTLPTFDAPPAPTISPPSVVTSVPVPSSPPPLALAGAAVGSSAGATSRAASSPISPRDVARAPEGRPPVDAGSAPTSTVTAETTPTESEGSPTPPPPSMDALARQVYSMIKQRLAVEKERLGVNPGSPRGIRSW